MTEQTQVEHAPVQLDVDDLASAVTIMDLAINNGGIPGWENVMLAHQTRNNLAAFVNDYFKKREEEAKKRLEAELMEKEEVEYGAVEEVIDLPNGGGEELLKAAMASIADGQGASSND